MKISIRMACCISIGMLLASCDPDRVFEENVTVPNNSWDKNEKLVLKADITDTTGLHDVYINVRNAGWYPFSNLFLFINTTLPDGRTTRDTAECTLADADGRWLGDGLGDIWDNRIPFKKKFRFPMAGTYTFELEQGMRVNPLPGIADAGIRIEKSGN